MSQENIGIYSGWGIEKKSRNFGDLLCHIGLLELLKESGFTAVDLRNSINPITYPWQGPLIIGGGTVLPTIFENWVGPGLKSANPIIVYGSGVLSPDELERKNIHNFDKTPYQQISVAGVRGPLSAQHYKEYFGQSVEFVGDLAFYFTDIIVPECTENKTSFFVIETALTSSRLFGSLHLILQMYSDIAQLPISIDSKPTLYITDHNSISINCSENVTNNPSMYISTLEMFISSVASAQVVVSERLHPTILASILGIPFIYFQTTSKSKDLELLLRSQCDDDHFLDLMFIDMSQDIDLAKICENYQILLTDKTIKMQLIQISRNIKKMLIDGSVEVKDILENYL